MQEIILNPREQHFLYACSILDPIIYKGLIALGFSDEAIKKTAKYLTLNTINNDIKDYIYFIDKNRPDVLSSIISELKIFSYFVSDNELKEGIAVFVNEPTQQNIYRLKEKTEQQITEETSKDILNAILDILNKNNNIVKYLLK
ncbi:MAG: hypothetical protein FWD54_06515 [Endomicrobia bacterium]|nr:hypothetical protein [Endomicrobiia bacterium]